MVINAPRWILILGLAFAGGQWLFCHPGKKAAPAASAIAATPTEPEPSAEWVAEARRVFAGSNCGSCHRLAGVWNEGAWPLDRAGVQRNVEQLKQFIRDPHAVQASNMMPPQPQLSETQLEAMAQFLASCKSPVAAP